MPEFDLLSEVALTQDIPAQHLFRGQVGTIVENLAAGVFEVEFSDDRGQMYASVAVPASQLLRLYHESKAA